MPLSTKKRNDLSGGEFALPEQRKYPINDATHVRNAAARLEQEHKSGKISDADYASAKRRIASAAKRFGVTSEYNAPKKGKRLHIRADIAHGGSLSVRHMSDRDVVLDGVAITCVDDTDAKPIWIQLAKPGLFKGHPAGPFELNAQIFNEIVANFKATTNRAIPIDFEHASEMDATDGSIPTDGAPAQGWIRDVKIEGGNLWGLAEWGDKAREYIRSGQYKFFSPAIRFNARDRVTGERIGARMTSGALTNNPFLDGLKPLAAKDAAASATMRLAHQAHEYMPQIRSALRMSDLSTARECSDQLGRLRDHLDGAGGDPNASHEGIALSQFLNPLRDLVGRPGMTWEEVLEIVEEMIEAAIDENVEDDEGAPPPMPSAPYEAAASDDDKDQGAAMSAAATENAMLKDLAEATAKLNDAQTKIAELSLSLKDEAARADKAEGEVKELRDWKDSRETKDFDDRVGLAFDTYKDSRKLTDADKEAMLIVLKAKPETFEKQYPKVKPSEQHLLKNVTDKREAPASTALDTPGDEKLLSETHAQTTRRLMSEQKLSYIAASNLAFKLRGRSAR